MSKWGLLQHKVYSANTFDVHYDFLVENKIDCLTWKILKLPILNEKSVGIVRDAKIKDANVISMMKFKLIL